MRRGVAALVVVAMMGGCSTYRGSKTTAKAGGVITLSGVASFALWMGSDNASNGGPCTSCDVTLLAGLFLFPIGATLALGGLLGMAVFYPRVTAEEEAKARDEARRAEPHEYMLELTRQARDAAQAQDCALVKQREISVRALDLEFYTTVFARDAAIKRCLDVAAPASVTTPAPQVTQPGPTP